VSSAFECSVHGRGVADFGIDHDIGDIVVKPRRFRPERGLGVGHRRQYVVVDDDAFGRVLRRSNRLGDDESDRGADMANAVGGQDVMCRDRYRRAVAIMKNNIRRCSRRGEMRDRLEPIGAGIVAGEHRDHAGHFARGRRIEAAD